MKNSPLLSIIVPCYNNEDYIYECLSSIKLIDENDVEIIIVNDGSTDNSAGEINRYISDNIQARVRLIDQKNQGLSMARNNGIDIATGEYIAFLDGDDLFSEDYLKVITPILNKRDVDMVIFDTQILLDDTLNNKSIGVNNLKNGEVIRILNSKAGYHDISSADDLVDVFERGQWYAWCRIYKKTLFDGHYFPKGRSFEDVLLVPFITLKVKQFYYANVPLVIYRKRPNSITTTPKISHIDDLIFAIDLFNKLYSSYSNNLKFKKILAKQAISTFKMANRISRNINGYIKYDKNQQQELKTNLHPFLKEMKVSLRLKVRFMTLSSLLDKVRKNKNHRPSS